MPKSSQDSGRTKCMLGIEVAILGGQNCMSHIYWDAGQLDASAILRTHSTDLRSIGIFDDRRLAIYILVGIGNLDREVGVGEEIGRDDKSPTNREDRPTNKPGS